MKIGYKYKRDKYEHDYVPPIAGPVGFNQPFELGICLLLSLKKR